jgi:hypothetical protein
MKQILNIVAWVLIGFTACTQQQIPQNKLLGTLELSIGGQDGINTALFHPRASTPLADTAIALGGVINVYGQDTNYRYVTAQFNLTATQAFSNLTLYAYNKTGNLGGTAVKGLTNFTGGAVAGTAQSLLPINSRDNLGNVVTNTADFQGFSSNESSTLQAAAVTANLIAAGEQVLQYGYVARKNAITRAFASGNTGTITLAYKIPIGSQNTNTYKFSATFVVADETPSRVTRDIDESASAAASRANAFSPAATQVMLIGADTQNTPLSAGLRFSNIKIGTNTNLLPNTKLAIYRVGDGAAALSTSAQSVFIDIFDTLGNLFQSIAMPTTGSGANKSLVSAGTNVTEGFLTLSEDGKCLLLTGYNAALGTASISTTTAAATNRVVGIVAANGAADTSSAFSDYVSTSSPRSAASNNCVDLWFNGSSGGVRYATKGSSISTQVATNFTNLRMAGIFDGQLFTSAATGALRLGTVGIGLPTTTGQTITNLPGLPTAIGSPYGFVFADLNSAVAGMDTLYYADDTATTGIGGINKYSLVAGAWVTNGVVGTSTDSYRGLTALTDGSQVTLFTTRKNRSEVATLVDSSGYNAALTGTPTLLATAAINTAFQGIAIQPR